MKRLKHAISEDGYTASLAPQATNKFKYSVNKLKVQIEKQY